MIRRWIMARLGPWAGPIVVALVYTLLIVAFLTRIYVPQVPFPYGHL